VRYGKTYGMSSGGVAVGAGSTSFRVPGAPPGNYTLVVVANGIASAPAPLTVSATAARCNDGIANGDEIDVDCGGSCVRCADGQHCTSAADCSGPVCNAGVCLTPSCTDGVRDNRESDVDCGGPVCHACSEGQYCRAAADCAEGQGRCMFGTCSKIYCSDGVRDLDETGVDCGGPNCPACGVVEAPSCHDGVKDNSETDVDCGGPNCSGCLEGHRCVYATDCAAGLCAFGACTTAYCHDGGRDYDETDVDCGGPTCASCSAGFKCASNRDCQSMVCVAAVCH
jgi:hypothetical protein